MAQNRSIKYQYWYSGKMLEVDSIQFMENGTYIVNDELVGGVLREWTGLKDKNGKEIYEGDIVRHEWFMKAQPFEIENTPSQWHELIEYGVFDDGYIEVIGNVYEQPELASPPKDN